ncbi:hypothetical protein Tco_0344554 [Tanacetum coccineum]
MKTRTRKKKNLRRKEEDPQEEEDDMEVDIEEDENEPELTYPYEETDSLNHQPPASKSEPGNEIEVENPIEHEDKTVPVSVYECVLVWIKERLQWKSWLRAWVMLKSMLCGKKLKKELEEARLSNTFLRIYGLKKDRMKLLMFLIEDEKSPLSEPQGSPPDVIGFTVERERQANVRNDASGSGPVRGRDTTPAIRECTFAGFIVDPNE